MFEYLWFAFIAPLEWLIHFALDWAFTQTQSYGFGIIVASLIMAVIQMLLYYAVEHLREQEYAKQQRLAKKLAHIKQTFSSVERYMVTKTLYRQHQYRPFLAFCLRFSVFIAVPFFFAAYIVFATYPPLQGASFAYIPDLSKPDALLLLGGITIHVLPLLMTIISITSIQIGIQHDRKGARFVLYSLSALFLYFSYNAPSSMTLYWLCNATYFLIGNLLFARFKPPAKN